MAAGGALGAFARAVARLWFRRLDRSGPALPPGPVLLVLNHPNGLLDPLLAAALLERPPRFVAKAALWRIPPLRPFLALFRAIPVHRSQDAGGPGDAAARARALAVTFAAVHGAFRRGEVVGIFPEGVSQAGADLAPLKTGPARMVLGAPVPVAVVPAGLVYGDLGVFRHGALLRVGEPVDPAGLADLEGPAAVAALTARIRAALLPLTLQGSDPEAVALARDLAWLLAEGPRPRADLAALQARDRTLLAWLGTLDPEARAAVRAEVDAVQAWLRTRGLRPDQVGHPYPLAETLHWLPRAALRALLALACLPAAILHLPAWLAVDRVARRGEEDLDMVATTKLVAGALLWPLWTLALGGLAGALLGPRGLAAWALSLPLAVLALPLADALREDLRAVRGWRARRAEEVPDLLEARTRLLAAVPALAGDLRRPGGTG